MTELKTIRLYGDLGDKFGREFHFAVKSPAEAIRLLSANFKDFSRYLFDKNEPGYHVFIDSLDISEKELTYPVSSREVIKIVPVISGSGKSPLASIILGAALIASGYGIAAAYNTSLTGLTGFAAFAATASVNLGTALVIGGVSQLLTSPPSSQITEAAENKPSYAFDGAVNTIRQGNCVPVGYGRLRVGSQLISAGTFSETID